MKFLFRIPLFFLIYTFAAVGPSFSADKDALDWTAWRNLPVFKNGRMMPLDSFARNMVEAICGRENPTLFYADAMSGADADAPEFAEAKKMFPNGVPRKFSPGELLFSWLVEPEKWEYVPFLAAENKELRQEALKLPLFDKQGRRLRYASPNQVSECLEFVRRLADLQVREESEGAKFKPLGIDKHVRELFESYACYRNLTYDPKTCQEAPRRFSSRLRGAAVAWKKLSAELRRSGALGSGGECERSAKTLDESLLKSIALVHGSEFSLRTAEPAAAEFHKAAEELGKKFIKGEDKVLASLAADLMHQAEEMHAALYDDGGQLRLVPALNSAALEENREPGDDAQPWLGLQTLLKGSDDLMQPYFQAGLKKVRFSFAGLAAAYMDRADPKRPEKFHEAMNQFASALRGFAAEIEPLRRALPTLHEDETLLASTAYPREDFGKLEVFYNSLNPFFWSWLLSLVSLVLLALAVGVFRKTLFWPGVVLLAAGQAITILGFCLRGFITGLVPLTGMFETTVFVALCVGVLGLWFALLPIIMPGWRTAWSSTSLPARLCFRPNFRAPKREKDADPASMNEPAGTVAARWVNLFIRAGLIYLLFEKLVIFPGRPGIGYFNLLPKTILGESLPTIGSVMVWMVGWCVLLVGLYFLPRLMPAAAMSLITVPCSMFRQDRRGSLAQAMDRKAFVIAGAAACFLAALAAYYAPPEIMHKGFDLPRPILRDNFWLFVHVLTITASYGAGALAWGLGNIALGYYLFGRYCDAESVGISPNVPSPFGRGAGGEGGNEQTLPSPFGRGAGGEGGSVDKDQALTLTLSQRERGLEEDNSTLSQRERKLMECRSLNVLARRPPEICSTLAGYIYKATQVAVVLLAAGTILGALWADVAWGRFWGWDAKEVWALVSLLVYMTILHGRYTGWSGDFGLALGSVLGATAIMMAWYGVNFFLGSGLHSYASGAGGQWEVGTAVVLNWLFLIAAAFRYRLETGISRK
jgi:ABC-type transport system involved in cytochrome c biogenesis permease subunit